jgi:hypothetical protein
MGELKKIADIDGGMDNVAITEASEIPLKKGRDGAPMVPVPAQPPTPPKAPAPQKKT